MFWIRVIQGRVLDPSISRRGFESGNFKAGFWIRVFHDYYVKKRVNFNRSGLDLGCSKVGSGFSSGSDPVQVKSGSATAKFLRA